MNLAQRCPACGNGPVNIEHDRGDEVEVVCFSCEHKWTQKRVKLVRVRFVQNDCEDCLKDLLEESKALGDLPLGGKTVLIPEHWLGMTCTHGRSGLKFVLDEAPTTNAQSEGKAKNSDEDLEIQPSDPAMDATRNIGFAVREHGPYGSHPMCDDFSDESDPDGPATYSGLPD